RARSRLADRDAAESRRLPRADARPQSRVSRPRRFSRRDLRRARCPRARFGDGGIGLRLARMPRARRACAAPRSGARQYDGAGALSPLRFRGSRPLSHDAAVLVVIGRRRWQLAPPRAIHWKMRTLATARTSSQTLE